MKVHLAYRDVNKVRYWVAEWTEPRPEGGRPKRCTRSLGVTGKTRAAREEARRICDAIAQQMMMPDPGPVLTTADFAAAYLDSVGRSLRPSTMVSYAANITRFTKLYGDLPLKEIRAENIEAFIASLKGLSPASINIALRSLRAMFRRAIVHGHISSSPMAGVPMARVPEKTFPPFLTLEQYWGHVEPVMPSNRFRAACRLAMFSGMRLGEIGALRWQDIDFDLNEIRIESRDGWQTKSGKGRVVPLLDPVRDALTLLPKSHQSVLGVRTGTKKETPDTSTISRMWRELVAKINSDEDLIPPITFHGLRHSYATWLAASGLPLRSLQAVLGHADIATTMIYTHVQPQHLTEQVRGIAQAVGVCGVFCGNGASTGAKMHRNGSRRLAG